MKLVESPLYLISRRYKDYTFKFNPETKHLSEQEHRPELSRCAVTKYRDLIYTIAGERNDQICDVGLKYNLAENTWKEFLCRTGKSNCGICTMHDRLFLIGGLSEHESSGLPQATCSWFDYETEQWANLPDMTEYRAYPAVSSYNSSLYVLGGFSNQSNRTIERFDPREGCWANSGTGEIFGVCSSTVKSDTIYYLNTHTGKHGCYDPRSCEFSFLDTAPKVGRWIDSKDGQIYLLHYEGIDIYREEADSWETLLKYNFEQCPILIA